MNKPPYGFTIEYTVPMRAIGKARPRFTRWGCTYTPEKTKKAEEIIRDFALDAMLDYRLEPIVLIDSKALAVSIEFAFSPPKSWSKKKKKEAIETTAPCTCKPDIDNLAKLVCDAMIRAVYTDDRLISEMHLCKFYAETDYIKICVWEVGDVLR